jgi:hypothetical protein
MEATFRKEAAEVVERWVADCALLIIARLVTDFMACSSSAWQLQAAGHG